jgi:hypothetical protein
MFVFIGVRMYLKTADNDLAIGPSADGWWTMEAELKGVIRALAVLTWLSD